MTQGNGSVGIRVQVPVLGVVSGVTTLADVIAGKPAGAPTEQPAVITRDIAGRTPLAGARRIAAAGRPKLNDGEPKAPAAAPAAPKPAASPDDEETEAKRLMQLAENYLKAGLKSTGITKLKEIVRKWPNTKAAGAAKERLAKLEG